MKIIKILSNKITEEICDAKSYAKLALQYKEEYPELSRTFYNLSSQEMDHMNKLHVEVTELIRKYREQNGEPPADMMAPKCALVISGYSACKSGMAKEKFLRTK